MTNKSLIKITTRLKTEVLDPEAKTILQQLHSAGYSEISNIYQEKSYILYFSMPVGQALKKAEEIANNILCNVAVHDWNIKNITKI